MALWPDVNQGTDGLIYGMSGGQVEEIPDDRAHNIFDCVTCKDRANCPGNREMMEDIYRHLTGINIASFHWWTMFKLHRILNKLKKMYPSLDAAMSARDDPRAQKLLKKQSNLLGEIWADIAQGLNGVEQFRDKHGHYPGMEGIVFKDDKERKREDENSSIYG